MDRAHAEATYFSMAPCFSGDGEEAEALHRRADGALYAAKAARLTPARRRATAPSS